MDSSVKPHNSCYPKKEGGTEEKPILFKEIWIMQSSHRVVDWWIFFELGPFKNSFWSDGKIIEIYNSGRMERCYDE
ncbi:MAG TPA: hypothetical protein VMW42_11535 [Desulfatiglandales bacterium]|nr:hypothetical protein [Desulfatiglandales bacterium]